MMLNINDIELGMMSQAGHKIYLEASYTATSSPIKRRLIVKENKHNNADYSRYEMAFSQLAYLLLGKNYTVKQDLVVDRQGKIFGLASEHILYSIVQKEGLKSAFYRFDNPELNCNCTGKKYIYSKDLPVYFLNKLPQGFFAQLAAAAKKGDLAIDYASLACILTGSYTLEEDDLHKGNFGFYLVEKQGKPQVVFFKVDHDLMFTNSAMSFYHIRPQHLFYDEHAFDITANDLLDFPKLTDSANTYWPTKLNPIAHPWSEKEFCDEAEVAAFADLAHNKEFKKAKWLNFYKHILIPPELNQAVLEQCFDKNKAADRAHMALIIRAMIARQAKLRAMLFSLNEFQVFQQELTKKEKYALLKEVASHCPKQQRRSLIAKLKNTLFDSPIALEEGDTALHTAIKLGDFRYEETLAAFGHLINQKNKAGKTPLDCALEMLASQTEPAQDVRKDLRLTMKYLLRYGASESPEFAAFNSQAHIEDYQFKTPYFNQARQCTNYAMLKELLRAIGEDYHYCLKSQKKLAVECVRQFIANYKEDPLLADVLRQLKKDISDEVPELKYIRQLRSSLWIIRRLRGLYGWTSTQGEINTLISHASAEITSSYSQDFFVRNKLQALDSAEVRGQLDGDKPSL